MSYHRLTRLTNQLLPHQALLLTNPADITYLTGFQFLVPEEREAWLVVTKNETQLFHASFSPYSNPYRRHRQFKVVASGALAEVKKYLASVVKQRQLTTLLVDAASLFLAEYQQLITMNTVNIESLDRELIWQVRTIKDRVEQAELSRAGQLTAQAMAWAQDQLRVGLTEVELEKMIAQRLDQLGSTKPAFPTIVAFGAHSALPHHQPTSTPLAANTPVLLDLGATVAGYRGDMTRTVWFGDQPSSLFIDIEQLVKQAYQAAIDLLSNSNQASSPLTARDLDQAARDVIAQAGYGSNFIHTTGHGVGLDIHESISLHWKNSQPILPGITLTIEPGVYLPKKFGYRHENTLLITDHQPQILTQVPAQKKST